MLSIKYFISAAYYTMNRYYAAHFACIFSLSFIIPL